MAIHNPKHGHRVMVLTGHLEHDTIDFVGMRGTIVAINSKDPIRKDRHEFVIGVKLDCRIRHDTYSLFRASDLTSANPKGK